MCSDAHRPVEKVCRGRGGCLAQEAALSITAAPFRRAALLRDFIAAVEAVAGVTAVRPRRFYRGALQLDIRCAASRDQLIEALNCLSSRFDTGSKERFTVTCLGAALPESEAG